MKVQSWSGTSQLLEGSMLVRNLSIPWRFPVGQEPLDPMKEQRVVRNLSIPWRNTCVSGASRFHVGTKLDVNLPVSRGGTSSMSQVVPEPLHSMKVQRCIGTSRFHGRFKVNVICCSGTTQFYEGSESVRNLPMAWVVQVRCRMFSRNFSIHEG